jgi:hypothetical protein
MQFFKKVVLDETDYSKLPFEELIKHIENDWSTIDNSPLANSLLEALKELKGIGDVYIADNGYRLVCEFLSNSSKWRSRKAKIIKNDLKRRLVEFDKQHD